MKLDLHIHSNYSDGTMSPRDIVRLAKQKGLDIISITDHDTIDGVEEAIIEGQKLGVRVLSGVEISSYQDTEIHMLGYNFDVNNKELKTKLDIFKQMRQDRVGMIFDRLEKFGIKLNRSTFDDVDSVGRLHVAKLLQKGGYVSSVNEAFDKYLGSNGVAYIPSKRIMPEQAIQMIVNAGGIAVIAHPQRFLHSDKLESLIQKLIPYGLGGIETYYPSHDEKTQKTLLEMAKRNKIIATGGTDFHGENRNVELGQVEFYMEKFSRKRLGILK